MNRVMEDDIAFGDIEPEGNRWIPAEQIDLSRTAADIVHESVNEPMRGGGKGPLQLPNDHVAAIQVPKGGSSCSNCKWLGKDGTSCTSQYFITWNGGDGKLPYPADEFCSDWYQPAKDDK